MIIAFFKQLVCRHNLKPTGNTRQDIEGFHGIVTFIEYKCERCGKLAEVYWLWGG